MKKTYSVVFGKKYGRWKVIKPALVKSSCRCVCGTERVVINRNLILGYSKSCGCLGGNRSVENLSGVHGDYSMLRCVRKRGVQTRTYWLAQCQFCGRKKWIFSGNLKLRLGLRCPCQIRDLAKNNVRSFWRSYVKIYRSGAKTRGFSWKLSSLRVKRLAAQPCFYCGEVPKLRKIHWRAHCELPVGGLDRIDSAKGYTVENAVSCCAACNRMKMNMSSFDFIEKCCAVAMRQKPVR